MIKVIGIGLPKTGTSTLRAALTGLKYRSARLAGFSLEDCALYWHGNFDALVERIAGCDGAMDWPWSLLYQPLARAFPGALFVLTTRVSEQTWFDSLQAHARRKHEKKGLGGMRPRVYGYEYPEDNPQHHMEFYRQHNDDVRRFFDEKSRARLLEVCWETGSGWAELCGALQLPVPVAPFPHRNRRPDV